MTMRVFDECKRLLLHNSGASALVGDALAIAGEMLGRHGMAVPSTHVLWNHEHLERAINEYFCAASDHDIDIERVQQAIRCISIQLNQRRKAWPLSQ